MENGGEGKGLIPRAACWWGLNQNRCKMQRSNKVDQLTKPLIPYLLKRALVWKRLLLRSFQSVSGQYGYLPFQPFCERFAVTFNVWHVSRDFWNWVFARDGGINLTLGSNRWVVHSCVDQLFWWVSRSRSSCRRMDQRNRWRAAWSSEICGDDELPRVQNLPLTAADDAHVATIISAHLAANFVRF